LPHVSASGCTIAEYSPAGLGFFYVLTLFLLPHVSASDHSTAGCTPTDLLLITPFLPLL